MYYIRLNLKMDWKSFFIGIAFLLGGVFFYKSRNWGRLRQDDALGVSPLNSSINSMEKFRNWMYIIMCVVMAIVFFAQSLPK
jgi:hypothetical protein